MPRPCAPAARAALAAAAVAAVALALPAAAQQPTPRVPSLTPGVFESRGTAAGAPRVSLPDLERQPLSGFGPPPRTWIVPAEREPTTAPFAPDPDGLPALALDAPPAPDTRLPEAHTLRLEAGAGTRYARYVLANVDRTGESGRFFLDAAYDGLNQEADPDYVGWDRLRLAGGGQSFARGRMRLDAHVARDAYDLLGTGGLERRVRRAVGGAWGLEGVGAVPYRVRLGYTQSRLGRPGGTEAPASESRMDAEAAAAFAREMVELDAAGGVAGAGSGFGTDVRYASGGAALALGRPDGARATLGLRGLWYDAAGAVAGGGGRGVGPIVDVSLPVGPALRAFAVNRPRLEVRSLASLAELNPYVAAQPTVVPDLFAVDAQAGAELSRGVVRLRAYGTALYAPTYLTFESSGGGALFTERYVTARAVGVGGDATLGAPDHLSASAALELRVGEASDGTALALFAPLVLRGGVQAPFADGRGRAGVSLFAESARPNGLGDTVPAWARLGADVAYRLTGPLTVVGRAERLAGSAERWPGFPEAPFTVSLGLRLTR